MSKTKPCIKYSMNCFIGFKEIDNLEPRIVRYIHPLNATAADSPPRASISCISSINRKNLSSCAYAAPIYAFVVFSVIVSIVALRDARRESMMRIPATIAVFDEASSGSGS
ncbi:hypothetical protein VNO77_21851 [Canavalia gladiata]|uniref:Uncharacterized protein n=1 Tax=Canavalia gladiata TaxID=3824 RepID=A0AAN9L1G4_CANGL